MVGHGLSYGLSYNDLCDLSPLELHKAMEGFERKAKDAWERARLIAGAALGPHMKRGASVKDYLPMPWDNEQKPKQQDLTRAEQKARFDELIKNLESET